MKKRGREEKKTRGKKDINEGQGREVAKCGRSEGCPNSGGETSPSVVHPWYIHSTQCSLINIWAGEKVAKAHPI